MEYIIVNNKKFQVVERAIENGVNWIYAINGRHGYAIADFGNGVYGKINKLF